MTNGESGQITLLLERANKGDRGVLDELIRLVNDELRGVADRHMRRVFGRDLRGITLQPTALVNETFLKLIKHGKKYDNRGHFLAIASKALENVLIDYHRQRSAQKRGGGWVRVPLDPDLQTMAQNLDRDAEEAAIPEVAAALEKLDKMDQRKANVVRLRVLWGLTINETAEALGIATATVERDWEFARAWLGKELANP